MAKICKPKEFRNFLNLPALGLAACTLFEGNYHFGVAALINSLIRHNINGHIYIGFKGDLPDWALKANECKEFKWQGMRFLRLKDDFSIYFLPITTDLHLANYKPSFLLQLQPLIQKSLVYFDPDICVKCQWDFFEIWVEFGVGIVQDIVMNNVSPTHPRRMQYKEVIAKSGKKVTRELYHIYNSGFCIVNQRYLEFLETWQLIINTAIKEFDYNQTYFVKTANQNYIFSAGDQDALNIALMCCDSPISDVGPEGMDFTYGGMIMSHAVGSPKPWRKNFIAEALRGYSPSLADKAYWVNAKGYINLYNTFYFNWKKACIKAASLIGRFYKRTL